MQDDESVAILQGDICLSVTGNTLWEIRNRSGIDDALFLTSGSVASNETVAILQVDVCISITGKILWEICNHIGIVSVHLNQAQHDKIVAILRVAVHKLPGETAHDDIDHVFLLFVCIRCIATKSLHFFVQMATALFQIRIHAAIEEVFFLPV